MSKGNLSLTHSGIERLIIMLQGRLSTMGLYLQSTTQLLTSCQAPVLEISISKYDFPCSQELGLY